jgi:hypothetical protein
MKTFRLLVLFAILGITFSCSIDGKKENSTKGVIEPGKVEVMYFHFTRRCATCKAVENVSQEAVRDLYGGKVVFSSYNLDNKDDLVKGKSLGISGQDLVIVSEEGIINITDEAFMNARNSPEKLKEIIKEKIDPLL